MWSTASADELAPLIDDLGNAVFVIEVLGGSRYRVLCINSRHSELTGLDRSRVRGRALEEALPADVAALLVPHYDECVSLGRRVEYEESIELAEGRRWWSTTLTPIRDSGGRIVRLLGSSVDVTPQKEAEARARRNEAHYRRVVNSVRDVIFETDAQGRWQFLNAAWTEITGFGVEGSLGRSFLDFIAAEDQARAFEAFGPLVEGVKPYYRQELRYRHRDGGYCWVEVYAQLSRDPGGAVTGTAGILSDVTERRAMEDALRHSAGLHELFFTQSMDGFFFMMLDEPVAWDERIDKERALDYAFAHQRMFKVNQAMLDQYGLTERDMVGMTPGQFFAHDPEVGRRLWRELFDRGRLHINTEERRADGSPVWVEGDYIVIRDAQGRIAGHFGVQRDITQQVRAERQLRESERRLRLIADNVPALISFVDEGLRYRYNNRLYSEWLGLEPEDLYGRPVTDVNHLMEQSLLPYCREALAGNRVTFEATGQFPDGCHYLQITYVPERGVDGRVRGFYSLAVDVSEQKRRELSLEQQASHDALTRLLNRRGVMERLRQAVARAAVSDLRVAALFLDLDDFKRINDSYGHDVGDALLQGVAERLCGVTRHADAVARLAGDEFVILLEGLEDPVPEAVIVAEKILQAMAEPLQAAGREIAVTVSIGIACHTDDEIDAEGLLQRADRAMYGAKAGGKGVYRVL